MTIASPSLSGRSPILVLGFAVTGTAVARHLLSSGESVVVVDDHPDDASRRLATKLGVDLVERPRPDELKSLVDEVGLVVVSPGVPSNHPIFGCEAEVVSELEFAGRLARQRGIPLVAVTGTNGKTTVTTLVSAMLVRSGLDAPAAGNIGVPLLEVLNRPTDMVVVEASSFQLALTAEFRPWIGAWINLAEDHLDWHPSFAHYAASKARIWVNQGIGDIAVANRDDPAVLARAQDGPAGGLVTFGLRAGGIGDAQGGGCGYYEHEGWLRAPGGENIVAIADLWGTHAHQRSNALAACAIALAAGATIEACRAELVEFSGLAHRLELICEGDGVRWIDDSKATTPSAALAAVSGFESVVLIAGGRNKGLDLSLLAQAARRIRAVVVIGEASGEIAAALSGTSRPVVRADSMASAVGWARSLALPGDVVLLSPGCSSFDWYNSYAERGSDFANLVRAGCVDPRAVDPKARHGLPEAKAGRS